MTDLDREKKQQEDCTTVLKGMYEDTPKSTQEYINWDTVMLALKAAWLLGANTYKPTPENIRGEPDGT